MIISVREEITKFDANFLNDGPTAIIRFQTASEHQTVVTLPLAILTQLAADLSNMVFRETTSLAKPSSKPPKSLALRIANLLSYQENSDDRSHSRTEQLNERNKHRRHEHKILPRTEFTY